MNVTLMQIKAFLAVARFESFTKAAELLHVSQPALTVQIKQLEDMLGVRLFDRNTRHVQLTRVGRDLVAPFQHLIQEFELVVANAQGIGAKRKGMVRFACLPSLASTYLPNAIALFRKQYPNVSFVLRDAVGKRILAMVRADEVEFGITDGEPNWPDLETLALYQDRMHVVFPKTHPIAKRKKIVLSDIIEYPLILLDPETNLRIVLDEALAAAGKFIMPACEVTHISTAVGMVRAGLGLTLLSSLSIKATNLKSIAAVQSRLVDDPPLVRHISLIKKAGRSLSPPAQSFTELLLKLSKKNPSRRGSDWV
jgi:DNA-binding transcriptional LysR family regulator